MSGTNGVIFDSKLQSHDVSGRHYARSIFLLGLGRQGYKYFSVYAQNPVFLAKEASVQLVTLYRNLEGQDFQIATMG